MEAGHRSRLRRLSRAVAYAVIVAVPLAVLALLVRSKYGPLADFDQHVITRATDFTRVHSRFRSAATVWEAISQPWVMYAVVGAPACAFAWLRLHLPTRAAWAVATMATGWGVAAAVKAAVQRARPEIEDPFAVHAGYSFPSGHATNNALVVTTVLVLFHPVLTQVARRVLLGVGVAWVLGTCLDRIFLGAHFPSDVAAGLLLGCGMCAASYAGFKGWSPPTPSDIVEKVT